MRLEAVTLFRFHRYKSRAENPPRTRRERVAIARDASYLLITSGIQSSTWRALPSFTSECEKYSQNSSIFFL